MGDDVAGEWVTLSLALADKLLVRVEWMANAFLTKSAKKDSDPSLQEGEGATNGLCSFS